MKIHARLWAIPVLMLGLAACGDEPTATSRTQLEAVDVQEGTISDEMITLDNIPADGTAIDSSFPAEDRPKAPRKAAPVEENANAATADSAATPAPAPAPAASTAATTAQ